MRRAAIAWLLLLSACGCGSPWPYDREVPVIAAGPGMDDGVRLGEHPSRVTRIIESLVAIPSSAPDSPMELESSHED